MDGFEIRSRKERIKEKYADQKAVKDALLAYEGEVEKHRENAEAQKEEYKQRLEALYNPLIEKEKGSIQKKSKYVAEREERIRKIREAADAGDERQQRVVNLTLGEINGFKEHIEASTKEIEKFDRRKGDISDYVLQEKRYKTFSEITGALYESQLTEGSSKYFDNVVTGARKFVANMNTAVTDDADLFYQIKDYCYLREQVEKYISKRTSIFGRFSPKGKMRLHIVKGLKRLLDEHEVLLQKKYDTLLETGKMSYIYKQDGFRIPQTLKELARTEYSRRLGDTSRGNNLQTHRDMREYMKGTKSINQKFLDENGDRPGFQFSESDSRFSQAFTCFRYNSDGTFNDQKDADIAKLYMDCIAGSKEVRKESLENVIKNFCLTACSYIKEAMRFFDIELKGDQVNKKCEMNPLLFQKRYKQLFMLSRFAINFASLQDLRSGKYKTGYGDEWESFAREVLKEKELEPYWKEADYYISAAQLVFQTEFERQAAAISISPDDLKVSRVQICMDEDTIEGRNLIRQEGLKNAYRLFKS